MYVLFTGYYFDGFHGSMLHICEMSEYFSQNGFKCYCASVFVNDYIVEYCKKRNLIVLKANEIPINIEYEYVFFVPLSHTSISYWVWIKVQKDNNRLFIELPSFGTTS